MFFFAEEWIGAKRRTLWPVNCRGIPACSAALQISGFLYATLLAALAMLMDAAFNRAFIEDPEMEITYDTSCIDPYLKAEGTEVKAKFIEWLVFEGNLPV